MLSMQNETGMTQSEVSDPPLTLETLMEVKRNFEWEVLQSERERVLDDYSLSAGGIFFSANDFQLVDEHQARVRRFNQLRKSIREGIDEHNDEVFHSRIYGEFPSPTPTSDLQHP